MIWLQKEALRYVRSLRYFSIDGRPVRKLTDNLTFFFFVSG